MKISRVPAVQSKLLSEAVHDASTVAAVVSTAPADGGTSGTRLDVLALPAGYPGFIPVAAGFGRASAASGANGSGDDLKTLLRDFLAPVLESSLTGHSKLVVKGALSIWASYDAWKTLSSEEADGTGKTIAVTRAAASIVATLLDYQTPSPDGNIGNVVAGAAIGVADTLHRKKAGRVGAVDAAPSTFTGVNGPPIAGLTPGYLIGTNQGLFALNREDLLTLAKSLPKTAREDGVSEV